MRHEKVHEEINDSCFYFLMMVSFTKLRFQPGHFHRWYGITNISLFWPRMVQTPQMIILQVHIRIKNTCCLVASLWKWAFRYDNGLVSTGWQTVFVSSAIHFSDDWIHKQKYSALSISRGHVSHYRDVLMSAMVRASNHQHGSILWRHHVRGSSHC